MKMYATLMTFGRKMASIITDNSRPIENHHLVDHSLYYLGSLVYTEPFRPHFRVFSTDIYITILIVPTDIYGILWASKSWKQKFPDDLRGPRLCSVIAVITGIYRYVVSDNFYCLIFIIIFFYRLLKKGLPKLSGSVGLGWPTPNSWRKRRS